MKRLMLLCAALVAMVSASAQSEFGAYYDCRLAAHQMKFIRNLEMALVRIENKTYGICKTTGKLIPKERLMRVPHATQCIEAKEGRR